MKVLTKPLVKFLVLLFILFAITIAISSLQHTVAKAEYDDKFSIIEVEKQLLDGNYLQTLSAAMWAAEQGPSIVPTLDAMLTRTNQYKQERHGITGAFPFNAVWALAHIDSPTALAALEKFYATSQDDTAHLAISGFKLRREMGSRQYGILIIDSANLYCDSSLNSPVTQVITKGQPVKILKSRIENSSETNSRGGKQIFDYVELLPSGICGFIPRNGDDFPPFI